MGVFDAFVGCGTPAPGHSRCIDVLLKQRELVRSKAVDTPSLAESINVSRKEVVMLYPEASARDNIRNLVQVIESLKEDKHVEEAAVTRAKIERDALKKDKRRRLERGPVTKNANISVNGEKSLRKE